MLWKLVSVTITRETDQLDVNNNYVKTIVYNWNANFYVSNSNRFVFTNSQSEPKQEFIFNLPLNTLVQIWDVIVSEWIKSKINTLPKTIRLIWNEFIKVTSEFIWN